MDLSDIRAYPPRNYSGLIVFRLKNQARDHVLGVGALVVERLRSVERLAGQLWIVEETRIRVRN